MQDWPSVAALVRFDEPGLMVTHYVEREEEFPVLEQFLAAREQATTKSAGRDVLRLGSRSRPGSWWFTALDLEQIDDDTLRGTVYGHDITILLPSKEDRAKTPAQLAFDRKYGPRPKGHYFDPDGSQPGWQKMDTAYWTERFWDDFSERYFYGKVDSTALNSS